MNHTPGPWEVDGDDPYAIKSVDYGLVAWVSDEPHENKYLMEQQRATARLIASAPELLEAAQFVVDCHMHKHRKDPMDDVVISASQFKSLVAAIEKAIEGGV